MMSDDTIHVRDDGELLAATVVVVVVVVVVVRVVVNDDCEDVDDALSDDG